MITAAEALVNALLVEDTRHMFGIPGTQNLPILDVLRETPDIRFILTRHEQGAGFMAYGYAKVSGKPGVVTATEGPGATNLVTPIAAAHKGRAPIIAISGSPDRGMLERDASQDIDQRAMFTPITRWAATMPSGSKVPELMRKAFRHALGVPPGPIHLDVSKEILRESAEWEPHPPASYRPGRVPSCVDSDVQAAYALLETSARPLILTGAEQMEENAGQALIALAEELGAPVVTTQENLDAFPSVHPLSLGAIGRSAWPQTLATVKQADLVLVIGARLDSASTLFGYDVLPRDARIVLNTLDARQVGNFFPVAHAAVGSISSFTEGLAERIRRNGLERRWLDVERVRAQVAGWRSARQSADDTPVQVPFATRVLRQQLRPDAVLCVDAGNATKHVRTHWDTFEPRTFFTTDDFGAVGCAFPMAIGAKLAAPERQVVAAVGDMGFICNLGELETCVREGIDVVTVVFNDQGLGNEKAYQDALYGGRRFAVDYNNPDIAQLARVFGAHGERVERPEEFGPALDRSLTAGKAAVIDVLINPEALAPVVLPQT